MNDIPPLLDVADLRVDFDLAGRRIAAVRGVSLSLRPGQCLGIVGESGSGKSVTARALLGLAGDTATVRAERLRLGDRDLTALPAHEWRDVRGREIGLVLQDALASLNPLRPIGPQVAEPLRAHGTAHRQARVRAVELLHAVSLPDPGFGRRYPHQLSGGQRQRALIAAAIACEPPLLIADEPTTALDATVQAQILDLLAELKASGTALLLISHDLGVVARLADHVAVMRQGLVVETAETAHLLADARHPYTRQLIAAVPGARARGTRILPVPSPAAGAGGATADPGPVLLEARGLVKQFGGRHRYGQRPAVDDVSFHLRAGETLGLVGESGSGKTTVARIVLAAIDPDAGRVTLDGRPWSGVPERRRRDLRRTVQAIHQDPLASFDPRFTVEQIVGEALDSEPGPTQAVRRAHIVSLLDSVGLDADLIARRPLQLSGGQRQRVAIARALAPEPRVLVCDEPVSALDVTVQAQILDLLADLRRDRGLAMLFISHDLGVVRHISDRVAVMRAGRIVETGDVESVFADPQHAYTRTLLAAVPRLGVPAEGRQ